MIVGIERIHDHDPTNSPAHRFKQQLRDSLRHETLNSRAIKIAKHDSVYTCGEKDEMVYFIEKRADKTAYALWSEGTVLSNFRHGGDYFKARHALREDRD